MAKRRSESIAFSLRKGLQSMYQPGESKKKYINETNRLRDNYKKELISQGYTKKEAHKAAMSICTYRNIIFSKNTLLSYQKSVGVFQRYCIEVIGSKRISMDEAALHVQDFVYWCENKGYSPHTINLHLSAVCKALHLNISDYQKPIRHNADITRSAKPAKNDAYNAKRAEKALGTNRLIGVRRSELGRIKLTDIAFISDDRAEVHSVGKGGKHNMNLLFTKEDVAALKSYVDEAASKGQVYLLTKEEMENDADLHSMRAERAKDVYQYVLNDMTAHPERREYYIHEIEQAFKKAGKTIKEDLSSEYRCTGRNKQALIAAGKDYVFDRVAVMFVSCYVTNHFRSNVTVNNYLKK